MKVMNTWERASYSKKEWQDYFQASNQGKDLVMWIDDIKVEAQAFKGFDSFRT